MSKINEPHLAGHKATKYILKQVTKDGKKLEFPGPYPQAKTLEEFIELIKDPEEGGVFFIIKRVETIKETICKSIPNI